jgi:hypothetical protein
VLCQVAELCKAAEAEAGPGNSVRIANFLCPGNYAVSGSKEACDAVEKLAKGFKARMAVSPSPLQPSSLTLTLTLTLTPTAPMLFGGDTLLTLRPDTGLTSWDLLATTLLRFEGGIPAAS